MISPGAPVTTILISSSQLWLVRKYISWMCPSNMNKVQNNSVKNNKMKDGESYSVRKNVNMEEGNFVWRRVCPVIYWHWVGGVDTIRVLAPAHCITLPVVSYWTNVIQSIWRNEIHSLIYTMHWLREVIKNWNARTYGLCPYPRDPPPLPWH